MFVKDFMTRQVITVGPRRTVREALATSYLCGVRRLPVVSAGALLGIVTRRDLCDVLDGRRTGDFENVPAANLPVSFVMRYQPVTVGPDETLESAALIMLSRNISGLPVVENGSLVGIITRSDLLAAFAKLLGSEHTGARVVLALGPGDPLERIRRTLAHLRIQSLVTYHDPKGDRWTAVVRVCGRQGAGCLPEVRSRSSAFGG